MSTIAERIEADVAIVGGGTAGCIVARRVADAHPSLRVVLVEAGAGRDTFATRIPGMTIKLMGDPKHAWIYASEPDPSLGGRVTYWSGGRMLGGSSSINGLVYIRGLKRDYDAWAEVGATGWGWNDVEPWFRKAERFEDGGLASLGTDGPYTVSRIRSLHPLTHAYVAACREYGLPTLEDYNDGGREGAFVNLTSQERGQRSSTGSRYLPADLKRPNLTVLLGVHADRVLFDGARAVGVRCVGGAGPIEISARAQVVLCMGALQTPAVLLRSGVGPAAHLRDVGVDVRIDAAGVGRNLQDHCGLTISKYVGVPTYNSQTKPLQVAAHVVKYLLARRGLLASAAVQGMGWARTEASLAEPDIHLNFLPFGVDYTQTPPALETRPAVSLGVCVSRPHSRGEIRLRSTAPQDLPVLDHRLIGDERDVRTIMRSIELMEKIFTMPALRGHVVGAANPPQELATDAALEQFVRQYAGIGYHAIGTCRMGTDEAAVVDTSLRVCGAERLRVIDASVMPRLVSANTNAASIMIGERGADVLVRELR